MPFGGLSKRGKASLRKPLNSTTDTTQTSSINGDSTVEVNPVENQSRNEGSTIIDLNNRKKANARHPPAKQTPVIRLPSKITNAASVTKTPVTTSKSSTKGSKNKSDLDLFEDDDDDDSSNSSSTPSLSPDVSKRTRWRQAVVRVPTQSTKVSLNNSAVTPPAAVAPEPMAVDDGDKTEEELFSSEPVVPPVRSSTQASINSKSQSATVQTGAEWTPTPSSATPSTRVGTGTSQPETRHSGISSNKSQLSSHSITRSQRSSVSRKSHTDDDNSEIYGRSPNYDNDPDWLEFSKSVEESPETAHKILAAKLLKTGTPNCTALLGKLICKAISDQAENRINDKCAATIVRAVLHLADTETNCVVIDVVNIMFVELRHFTTGVLYSLINYCLEFMKSNDRDGSIPLRWIEVFGKIVTVITGRGDIKHDSDVIDGQAYKEEVINGICRIRWTTTNTASFIAIIKEIPGLEDHELKIIFTKLNASANFIKPAAFPPVVHQLISLAGNKAPSALLSFCDNYFRNVDFTNVTSLEVRQKRHALGTVVYHFVEASRHCDTIVKAVTKVVKASFFDFGHVMSPFILTVALGLTTFDHAKDMIIDPLRTSVIKSFHSRHLCRVSYWFRETVGEYTDRVTECFKAVLDERPTEMEFMFHGIRELAIGLLNADAYQTRYPNTMEDCRRLGSYLITSIVKNCDDQLPAMMKHLLEISSKSNFHTECFAKCLDMKTRRIIDASNIGRTCEIIRHLPMMNSISAGLIVTALSKAFHLSYTLLDQLMINLRKTIWKSVEARRTAAKIMIILLSSSRVVGDIPFSQYSESQRMDSERSNLSQNKMGDQQPLCLEILTLTKRCFSQQCEIREELYLGFHTVVRKNPGLCELICSQLYKHAKEYVPESEHNPDPRVILRNVVDLQPNTAVSPSIIKEELGYMVQCLAFVIHKSHAAFATLDEGPPVAVEQLEDLVEKLMGVITTFNTEYIKEVAESVFEKAGGVRLVENCRFIENVYTIQLMQVIEALIEFLHLQNKRGSGANVKKLFKTYTELESYLNDKGRDKTENTKGKGGAKKGKGKGGGTGNKSRTTQGTQNAINDGDDECTILDSPADSVDSENMPPPANKIKKPDFAKRLTYKHILNLESLLTMFKTLYSNEENKGVFTTLCRDGPELEKFLLGVVRQKLAAFKQKACLHERNRHPDLVAKSFADIAGEMWTGLLNTESVTAEVINESQLEMLELKLEVINNITEYLCSSCPAVWCTLIKNFGDEISPSAEYDDVFPKFFNSWKSVVGWIPTVPDGEKKIHQCLFDILQSFAQPLTPDSGSRSQAVEVLGWTWKYMVKAPSPDAMTDFGLAESIVSCWLAYYMKGKTFLEQPGGSQHDLLTLAKAVRCKLGLILEFEKSAPTQATKMWIIDEDTAPRVLTVIMNFIETLLGYIMSLLAKLKSQTSGDEVIAKKAADIRENCFQMLNEILTVSTELVKSAFPAGLCSTTMLRVVPQIFNVMTGFGEYFIEMSKLKLECSLKGFSVPASRLGSDFKVSVDGMTAHMENVQRLHADEVYKKSADNSKKTKAGAKTNASMSIKNQITSETKLVPKLVYSVEKYDQQMIELSMKTQKGAGRLLHTMKFTTARDFKIDGEVMQKALSSPRSVQDMTSVQEDSTAPAPGTSTRVKSTKTPKNTGRKSRKRRKPESDGEEEVENVEDDT